MGTVLMALLWFAGDEPDSPAQTDVPALVSRLSDPDPNLRAASAGRLGKLGGKAQGAVPALLEALKDTVPTDRGPQVCQAASIALADIGEAALPALTAALESSDRRVYIGAASAIHDMGPRAKAAVPKLISLLEKQEPERRLAMIAGLQGIGPEACPAVPLLIQLLDSDDFHTQYWACRALGAIGPAAKPAVPALCRLTKAGLPSVRRNAAAALGKIGPEIGSEGLQTLIAALGDRFEPVRENAVIALGDLGGFAVPAVPVIRTALAQRKIAARVASARTWWKATGDPAAALPTLIEQLTSPEEAEAAAAVLGEIGPPAKAAVPALIEQLKSQDQEPKVMVCQTLARIGSASQPALATLRTLLQDEDPELRQAAEEAIRQITPKP